MSLHACLPVELRDATITPISAGLSGAGVYRVDAGDRALVLKVAGDQPLDSWRATVAIQQRAAAAGLTPRVLHVDEARRAVLSELVVDRSFPALFFRDRAAALPLLARTLRGVHALPLAPEAVEKDLHALVATLWAGLADLALPPFVGDAVRGLLASTPPPRERALVTSHNDVNPTNLVFDGERVLLLDWNTAGANDPLFDLAAIAVFLRMDPATCDQLLGAYDGSTVSARFVYLQRLVGALCGTLFLGLAHRGGHAGAIDAAAISLAELYPRLRAGTLDPASADGQWLFGLALVSASASYAAILSTMSVA